MVLSYGEFLGREKLVRDLSGFRLTLNSYDRNECLPMHSHEFPYLSAAIQGKYEEQTNLRSYTPNIIDQRSLLFRPSGYLHSNEFNKQGGVCFNIEFKDEMTLELLYPSFREIAVVPNSIELARIFHGFTYNESDDLIELHINELLSEIGRNAEPENIPALVRNAVQYIEDHSDLTFTLCEIGEELGVHPVYLARIFKKATGKTIGGYLSSIRIRNAFFDLSENEKLTALAYKNGFYDQSHFIRSFQKEFGISPNKIRKKLSGLI